MQITGDNVKDIKFAPNFFGLSFATAFSSGTIQVYTANLSAKKDSHLREWTENIDKLQTRTNVLVGCGVVEWGPAFDEPAMIAVGCEEIGNQKEQ